MNKKLKSSNTNLQIIPHVDRQDYIALSPIYNSVQGKNFLNNWLRTFNTLEFLENWENENNPQFDVVAFDKIIIKARKPRFKISIQEWIKETNAKGIIFDQNINETYAHQEIALHFAYYLSPDFQYYLLKEFKRLKEEEELHGQHQLKWNVRRELSKINYHIHTDAVNKLIPPKLDKLGQKSAMASEADLLNIALFGITAKEWRVKNQGKEGNIRDHASLEQLTILANLENLNAYMIESGFEQDERLELLNKEAIKQMELLLRFDATKGLQDLSEEDAPMLD